jgi:bile acid:Na+ symporter, BASS family
MTAFLNILRSKIENNINPIFFAAIGFGLIVPYADQAPSWVVMVLLATVMFLGCSKITLGDIKDLRSATSLWFYLVRYLLVPALFFFALKEINFSIAVAAMLISLAPSGVAAPALTGLVQGNVAFSLFMTAATSLLFVPIAPTYLSALLGREIPIDTTSLFFSLLYMMVAPLLAFGLVRWRSPASAVRIKNVATVWSVVLTFFVILFVIARVRNHFLEDPAFLVLGLVSVSMIFAVNYIVFGWFLGRKEPANIQNAMAMTSGANNIALALVIAVLYFPPKVQILMAIGEAVWVLAIPVFRIFVTRVASTTREYKTRNV